MSISRGVSMEAISLDDWELLPDHRSSFLMDAAECSNGNHGVGGGKDQLLLGAELVVIDMDHFGPTSSRPPPCDYCILHDEAKKPILLLPSEDACGGDPIADCKDMDIDVVEDEPEQEEIVNEAAEILVYEAEEQEEMKMIESVEEADQDDDAVLLVEAAAPDGVSQCARELEQEEEGGEGVSKTGFSVGSLRVNGIGALCSFGVAAATFCILLLGGGGGKQQQLHRERQGHKIQLQQMYAGDEKIEQVVQQASRLNQTMTMSSVMGGASSARASISFGGYYQGF